jgi:hypothetical protein
MQCREQGQLSNVHCNAVILEAAAHHPGEKMCSKNNPGGVNTETTRSTKQHDWLSVPCLFVMLLDTI